MRILEVKDIDKRTADHQKATIDESVKLARRVNDLRDTLSREEAELKRFRETSISSIYADISTLEERRQSLVSEVSILEKKRSKALEPIDAELKQLEDKRLMLSELEKEIESKGNEIFLKMKEIKSLEDSLASRKAQLDRDEKESRLVLERAHAELDKSKASSQSVQEEKIRITGELDLRERKLKDKEKSMADRERSLSEKEEYLIKKDIELSNKQILIEDRYRSLLKINKK